MTKKPPLDSFVKSPLQKEDIKQKSEKKPDMWDMLRGENGKDGIHGRDGKNGQQGFRGFDGDDGKDGKDGKDGRDGIDGKPGSRGAKGDEGLPGKSGIDGISGSPDTGDEIVTKVNKAKLKINKSQIKGFDDIESYAKSANDKIQKYLLMGGSTLVKLQANGVPLGDFSTLNFTNGTVTNTGGTANYTGTGGGGSSGYQQPLTPTLNQAVFNWSTAPSVIVIDGKPTQKVQTDGTIMWTGTTTTTLVGASWPVYDIFATN